MNEKFLSRIIIFKEEIQITEILVTVASTRKGANTDILLSYLSKGASNQNTLVEVIHLRDYSFQLCIGCERCQKTKECSGLNDDIQLIYPKIRESTGSILVSPVHNYNVTAVMKAFIDRLYCFYDFGDKRPGKWSSRLANQGRKAIIAAVGEQCNNEEGGMDFHS
jgi:multimeric flavodoxin WrbA